MATISLVMIVKNEAEILEKCLESVKSIVDEFCILDTGSTDGTQEIIKRYGKLNEIPFEDYVTTKNKALGFATCDYVLFMDADETIIKGLHLVKEAADKWVDGLECNIEEGIHGDYTSVVNQYRRMRLWKNDGEWKFYGPKVHEYISRSTWQPVVFSSDIVVRHEHTKTGKAELSIARFHRDIELLTAATKEDPMDTRAWFYLARTYKDLGQRSNAVAAYRKYLSIEGNTYVDERWQSAYDACHCLSVEGEYEQALEMLDQAELIDPRRAETWNSRAGIWMARQDYKKAQECYIKASKLPIPENVLLFLDPTHYDLYPKDGIGLSSYKLKEYDVAEAAYMTIEPKDERILNNLWWCHRRTRMTVFLCLGPTPEPIWGGMMKDHGVHGVETAYMELAQGLAKLGHTVFLFCNTASDHIYDGVNYVTHQTIGNYKDVKADVVVTSRWFDVFDLPTDMRIIWLQDAHFADPARPNAFKEADRIICSSQWHKDYILQRYTGDISVDKISIVPLGIRKEWFERVPKVKNRMVYASNPDRGLRELGQMWDRIEEAVPGAELVIAYGWEGLETWGCDEGWKAHVRRQRDEIEGLFAGKNVKFAGRMSRPEVSRLLSSAELLVYPNNFWETFCLVAIEAQAAGTPIVTTRQGALTTTCCDSNILIDGPPHIVEYQDTFVETVKNLFANRELLKAKSEIVRDYAINHTPHWDDVASLWQTVMWKELP